MSGRGSDGRCASSASEAAQVVGEPQSGHLSSGGVANLSTSQCAVTSTSRAEVDRQVGHE